MTSDDSNEAAVFSGTFRHGVDEKRRVQVPADWRPVELNTAYTLMPWPKHQAGVCLRVLPPKQLAKMMGELDAMPNTDPKKPMLKRYIGSESIQVTVDKAGRICLPADKAEKAGIAGEAVMVGCLDRFEIWSLERYEQMKKIDEVLSAEAFQLME
jgi:MraZ protein